MNKQIKLMRDYHCSPIWKVGGAEIWGSDDSVGDISLDMLPISEGLKSKLNRWQKLTDDYYGVMERIPGGIKSHYTQEEFETARKSLGLSEFPSDEEQEKQGIQLWFTLRDELGSKGYDVYFFSLGLAPSEPGHLLRDPSQVKITK